MNNLTGMEVIRLMDELGAVEPTRKLSTEEATIDLIFFKAFGIDWDKNIIYNELRNNINNLMDVIECKYNKGYCYLL